MFQKCGQKGNTNYTYGLRREQMEIPLHMEEFIELKESMNILRCPECNKPIKRRAKFCQYCGSKCK
jgi:rRNA maturation endonuclease Nob1